MTPSGLMHQVIDYLPHAPTPAIVATLALITTALLASITTALHADNRRRLEAADIVRLTAPLPPPQPLGRHRPEWARGTDAQRLLHETRETDLSELRELFALEDAAAER